MRLLTHNILICVKKSCTDNYPLILSDIDDIELTNDIILDDNNEEKSTPEEILQAINFIKRTLNNINYDVFYKTIDEQLKINDHNLPNIDEYNNMNIQQLDNNTLLNIRRLLMNIHIQNAKLKCPGCERIYKIHQGIPNMRLREDEV